MDNKNWNLKNGYKKEVNPKELLKEEQKEYRRKNFIGDPEDFEQLDSEYMSALDKWSNNHRKVVQNHNEVAKNNNIKEFSTFLWDWSNKVGKSKKKKELRQNEHNLHNEKSIISGGNIKTQAPSQQNQTSQIPIINAKSDEELKKTVENSATNSQANNEASNLQNQAQTEKLQNKWLPERPVQTIPNSPMPDNINLIDDKRWNRQLQLWDVKSLHKALKKTEDMRRENFDDTYKNTSEYNLYVPLYLRNIIEMKSEKSKVESMLKYYRENSKIPLYNENIEQYGKKIQELEQKEDLINAKLTDIKKIWSNFATDLYRKEDEPDFKEKIDEQYKKDYTTRFLSDDVFDKEEEKKKYNTPKEAFDVAKKIVNPISNKIGVEIGGYVYRDENGRFRVSRPQTRFDPHDIYIKYWEEDIDNIEFFYHTHVDPYADVFSKKDYDSAIESGKKMYVIFSDGTFDFFDPNEKAK